MMCITRMHVLSRVLREDSRRSVDIASSILRAFLALSTFTHLHSHLKSLRVLGLTLTVIGCAVQEHASRVCYASHIYGPGL